MAYFIANRGATIGGGSLGRTEQLPSLKILCVDLCARHLERLSDLGDIPTEVFIDLLRRAKEKATPAIVKRLQDVNARLSCQEVDITFWKQAVEGHILRRTVPAPGPVLVERVNHHKECLKDLLGSMASPSAEIGGGGGGGGGQDSREWSRDVTHTLQALEETPVSVGVLKATLIGKTVSQFRKAANPEVASTAAELVRRWKEAAGAAASPVTTPPGVGGSAAGSSGGGSGGEAVQRSLAEEKRRAVEEGFQCHTWESLYQYLELLRAEKVRASSKRAREARERELQKRPKLIVGKSKGQGYTEKTGRISRKSGAPSFFAATSSSSSPRAGGRGGGIPPLSPTRTPKKAAPVAARNNSSSSNSSSKHTSNGGASGGRGSRKKSGDSSPFGSRSSSSSSSRSSSTKSRTTTGGRGSGGGGGGGGGSSNTKKPRKKNAYNSGTMSVADLRRTVLHAQGLSTPMKVKTPLGGNGKGAGAGAGGSGGAAAATAADARVTPPKKSKFWK